MFIYTLIRNFDAIASIFQITIDKEIRSAEKIKLILELVNQNLIQSAIKTGQNFSIKQSIIKDPKVLITKKNSNTIASKALKTPKPKKDNPTCILDKVCSGYIERVKDFQNRNISVHQIEVLDQCYAENRAGEATCGFHTFKNCLVALGLNSQVSDVSTSWFQSKEIFEELHHFLLNFQPREEEDISINTLTRGLRVLAGKESARIGSRKISIPILLKPFQNILKKNFNKITMLNSSLNSDYSGLTSYNLFYLSNLAEFYHSSGPRDHAFMVGSNNHWVSLIVHKDQENNLHWYGLDSYENGTNHFANSIQILSKALSDPFSFIKENYNGAVGEDLQRKTTWFATDGRLKKEEYANTLIEQQEEYKNIISQSFNLMNKLGWLNQSTDLEINNYIQDLRILTGFYAQFELDNSPLNIILTKLQAKTNT